MAIFAIGDLHLSHTVDKPMDIFGQQWQNHVGQIEAAWCAEVEPGDIVLIPGDISWAMTLLEAEQDLEWIGRLPGHKVMIRGNHDYWWNGISKVRRALPPGISAIQNDAVHTSGLTICGTRGWMLPTHPSFTPDDEVILRREIERLRLSLESGMKHAAPMVVMLHYPPCGPEGEDTPFTELLEAFQVKLCLYGHLHGTAHRFRFEGPKNGVQYILTSADYLNFRPIRLGV